MEKYRTGTGQDIWVHTKEDCKGPNCVIHNPSNHSMKDWPTNWRQDRYMMERICPHGVGHPDPDDRAYVASINPKYADGVHGCDGCCV